MKLLPALWNGVTNTGAYAGIVLQLPVLLLQGQLSAEEAQISGPVGIAQMVGGAMSASIDTGFWFPILRLSAVLSAALAITNLLPLQMCIRDRAGDRAWVGQLWPRVRAQVWHA